MLFFPVWKGAFYAWCAQVPQRARAFHADCASNELKEVEIMTITVSGRKMPVTDALRQYAEEKVGNAIKAVDADTVSTEIVLYTEKNPANPLPAICEVTVRVKGHIVRVEESEEDMYAAIDVAAAKVARQLRKYKTRVLDKKVRATERIDTDFDLLDIPEEEFDRVAAEFDRLMDELSEDEIVRRKETEFTPMTEEEALVQIDLLGHDFFAYTDRDTNLVHILYRREDGGYGLLTQKED